MKFSKILSCFLSLALLASCNNISEGSESEVNTSLTAEQKAQVQTLLLNFKDFSMDYVECKKIKNYINKKDFIITHETTDESKTDSNMIEKKWFKINDADFKSIYELKGQAEKIMTSDMLESLEIDKLYKEENGEFYLSEFAGNDGGLLGTDKVYVSSIEWLDDSELCLYMKAFGDKDNWNLSSDFEESFEIMLKKSSSDFKISACDNMARLYVTWAYSAETDVFSDS